jgi:hypothetical protein
MAKRYRSLRREQRLLGGKIHFVDHFFPEVSQPPCGDKRLCDFIETRPGFGRLFWVHRGEAEDLAVNPDALPEGVDVGNMELAARKLQQLGLNVNPALLKKDEEEQPKPEPEPEEVQVPTLTKIHQSSKKELVKMVKHLGWDDIDTSMVRECLKEAVLEKAKSLMN